MDISNTMSFLNVFIFCFLTFVYLSSLGYLSNRFVYKFKRIENVLESSLLGIISLSVIGLISNFFVSLNLYFNTIILVISIIYLFFLNKNILKNLLKYGLIIAVISFLTILFDNTNRPDSGLYHLPYTSFINENKIAFGLANINQRFGIISILQYTSATNFNLIFLEKGILIPLVIIYSTILVFFFTKIFNNVDETIRILSFLFFSFILISINRYSGFGNDDPGTLFYFILIYYFLNNDIKQSLEDKYKILCLISLFIFLIKPLFVIFSLLPLLIFLTNYKKIKFFNRITLFCLLIFSVWTLKNFFISGCLLFPVEATCFRNVDWFVDPSKISLEATAWTKGWPDRYDKSLNYLEYLENLIWIKVWVNNHLKYIFLKLVPFFVLLFLLSITIIFKVNKNTNVSNKGIKLLILVNIFFLIIWFLLFPAYRYGMGIICALISLIFINVFSNRNLFENKYFFRTIIFFIILLSVAITAKNSKRIYSNFSYNYIEYPWPKKNSHYPGNEKLSNIAIKSDENILYYITPNHELCFYSKSPCSHRRDFNIKKEKILKFFTKYTIDNN